VSNTQLAMQQTEVLRHALRHHRQPWQVFARLDIYVNCCQNSRYMSPTCAYWLAD